MAADNTKSGFQRFKNDFLKGCRITKGSRSPLTPDEVQFELKKHQQALKDIRANIFKRDVLDEQDNLVIRKDVASDVIEEAKVKVDNISLYSLEDITLKQIMGFSKEVKYIKLDRRDGIINEYNQIFIFKNKKNNTFSKLHLNPSDFDTFSTFEDVVRETLGESISKNLIIGGVETAFDFQNTSFDFVDGRIIIAKKKKRSGFEEDAVCQTRYYGKHQSVMVLYDKFLESKNLAFQKTIRLESRLKGKNYVPTQNLPDLKNAMLHKDFNPFKQAYFVDYELSVSNDPFNKMFVHDIAVNGLHRTRRFYNTHNNFGRDSEKLFTKFDKICLGDSYHQKIAEFFGN
ncbi:MAG: hypothetical protein ABL930_12340 [Pseudobdellovibrio sp.]